MTPDYDVLIIGGGPGGSSLAWRMGQAGYRVALVDRKRFPRRKPCGEFLSPECLPILEGLGLRGRFDALGARHVAGMRIHGFDKLAVGRYRDIGGSPAPAKYGYALRREVFDHELLQHATACPEVTFLEGWQCRELLRGSHGVVEGARLTASDGQTIEARASWTVGADGVRSTVARELGVQQRIPWLDKFALTTHYAGVAEKETAEVHYFAGGYFAAAPVDDGLLSLNLVIDRLRLAERTTDWDRFLEDYLERVPLLRERMRGATRVTPVHGVGPLAYRTTRQAVDGAVLVGDACGYVDPMTGEGIYFALRTAELLAEALRAALLRGDRSRSAMRRYVRVRRREIQPRLALCSLLQRGLRHDGITRTVLSGLQARPGLADLVVSMTGDYVRFREILKPGVWWRAVRSGGFGS